MSGVSIVICCHNSRERLGETLRHLAGQIVPETVPWEVIVVDNGSTDDTAAVAEKTWPVTTAPLRVVRELKLGLSYARACGMREARYDFISLVDDDNRVGHDWVRLVAEIMTAQPKAGACGGVSVAACEVNPPAWFAGFARSYAVGEVAPAAGDVTWTKGYLWGAGLNIRRHVWQQLHAQGFAPLLSDRRGSNLDSGGDTELCRALRLAGWELYYDPRLQLEHFIPARRLTWDYLCRLRRAFGASSVALDAYDLAVRSKKFSIKSRIRESWIFQATGTLRQLLTCGAPAWSARHRTLEGDAVALRAEWLLGRWAELRRRPATYHRLIRSIKKAPWRSAEFRRPALHSKQ